MRAKFFIYSTCLLAIFTFGFMNRDFQTGTVKDIDGNVYSTIKIGNQWWMAENLRVTSDPEGNPITSYFYKDDSQEFGKYGRLYTWQTAMNGSEKENSQGIAPEGWHIPSIADWEAVLADQPGLMHTSAAARISGGIMFTSTNTPCSGHPQPQARKEPIMWVSVMRKNGTSLRP